MKKSKTILLFFLLLGCILLNGCGIRISTDLSFNQQFEGNRIISCYVSKQDMALHFKGDSSKIDSIIENHCPGSFQYSKEESNAGTTYYFQLNFESLDDYKTQLSSILNFTPQINYKGVDSLFSTSIELEENFTSIDLLRWFEILITEEYSISENQLESLWDIEDTYVNWQDKSYQSETAQIHISDYNLSSFDGITIYTEEKDDRTFVRRIQFAIPKSTLDKRVLELEQILEQMKPEETTGIWQTTDTGKIYEMTFQADDFKALSQKTSQALGNPMDSGNISISISDYQYFKLNLEYSENLDFSKFICTEKGEVPVTYYFKPNSMTEIDSDRIQREINNAFIPKPYEDGYYRIYSGNCSSLKMKTLGIMSLPVSDFEITTTIKKEEQLKREFTFHFNKILTEQEKDILSSVLASNKNEILSLKLKEEEQAYSLHILQTGTQDNLNHSSKLLFGGEGNHIQFVDQGILQYFSNRRLTVIKETIDLSQFIGDRSGNIDGKYILQDRSGNKLEEFYLIKKDNTRLESETDHDDYRFIELNTPSFSVHYTGSIPSMFGIIIFMLLVVIIIAGLYIFHKKNPMK